MKAEKINLEQKIEKQQKEVVSLFGKIESLNVSVASGLLIYEVIRQRGLSAEA